MEKSSRIALRAIVMTTPTPTEANPPTKMMPAARTSFEFWEAIRTLPSAGEIMQANMTKSSACVAVVLSALTGRHLRENAL
jgi:hypothetical protein